LKNGIIIDIISSNQKGMGKENFRNSLNSQCYSNFKPENRTGKKLFYCGRITKNW